MLALVAERKKLHEAVPEPGRLRGEAGRSGTSTTPTPMPAATARRSRTSRSKRALRRAAASRSTRPFRALANEALGSAPRDPHRHPARAQHLLDGAVLAHLLRGARASRSRTSSSPTTPPRRCGSRAASTARSIPATRRRSRRRTSTTCSSTSTSREEAAQVHLLPDPHARADLRDRHDGQRVVPDRRRRARRHEGGVHQGGRLLRAARHRVPRSGAARSSSRSCCARRMFETFGRAPRHHRGRERLRLSRGVEGARRSSTTTCRTRAARSSRRSRPRTASRSCCSGARTTRIPGLNHGIPEEFQVSAIRSSRSARSRRTREYLDRYFKEELETGQHQDAARDQPRVAGELLGQLARRRCGRRSSRRTTRTWWCSTCRRSSAATTRRPTASSTRSSTTSATPYAALHDIDANKPGGSIKIRVKTYAHSLKLHEERLEDVGEARRTSSRTASTRSGSSCSS